MLFVNSGHHWKTIFFSGWCGQVSVRRYGLRRFAKG